MTTLADNSNFAETKLDVLSGTPRAHAIDRWVWDAGWADKISQLLVIDENGKLLGALNMHDLFSAKVI